MARPCRFDAHSWQADFCPVCFKAKRETCTRCGMVTYNGNWTPCRCWAAAASPPAPSLSSWPHTAAEVAAQGPKTSPTFHTERNPELGCLLLLAFPCVGLLVFAGNHFFVPLANRLMVCWNRGASAYDQGLRVYQTKGGTYFTDGTVASDLGRNAVGFATTVLPALACVLIVYGLFFVAISLDDHLADGAWLRLRPRPMLRRFRWSFLGFGIIFVVLAGAMLWNGTWPNRYLDAEPGWVCADGVVRQCTVSNQRIATIHGHDVIAYQTHIAYGFTAAGHDQVGDQLVGEPQFRPFPPDNQPPPGLAPGERVAIRYDPVHLDRNRIEPRPLPTTEWPAWTMAFVFATCGMWLFAIAIRAFRASPTKEG